MTEPASKTNQVLDAIFEHMARPPKHFNITSLATDYFGQYRWQFQCAECGMAWVLTRIDVCSDPVLARYPFQDGHWTIIRQMRATPGLTPYNAWDRLQYGFLDDDPGPLPALRAAELSPDGPPPRSEVSWR